MSGQGGLPQTSAWHQQLPLYYKLDRHQLPTCLLHNLHKPKSPDKHFCSLYLHQFKMIFTASSEFWPKVKNLFQTLERAHIRLSPRVCCVYPIEGAGKVRRSLTEFFCQSMGRGPPGWHAYNTRCRSSNWHQSLPLLAGPASAPCSTVQLTGTT